MVKKLLFLCAALSLLANGLVYSKPKFTWTKISDGHFKIYEFSDRLVFVECVDEYNRLVLAGIQQKAGKPKTWEEIRANKEKLGFQKGKVVIYSNDEFSEADSGDVITYTEAVYEKGKKLYLQIICSNGEYYVESEVLSGTPSVIPSQERNYYIFLDGEELWGLKPVTGDKFYFETKRLLKERINRKTRQQIRAELGVNNYLYWVDRASVSPDGTYVAYGSNKESASRNIKTGGFDLWLVDTVRGTDELKVKGREILVKSWIDHRTLLYSEKQDHYFYDVEENKSRLVLKDVSLLNVQDDYILYRNRNGEQDQIYAYEISTGKKISFPKLPKEYTVGELYSLSPDANRFLAVARIIERRGVKIIFCLIDNVGKKVEPIKLPQGEKLSAIHRWLDNNRAVVSTYRTINRKEQYTTWVLKVE